jgi:hypothetical protein
MPSKTILDLSNYHYTQPKDLPNWNQAYFQKHAQTGDVLVFTGTSLAAKFIELTGPYSHVAIVVRFGHHPSELMVCEAQQQVGFRCYQSWRMFEDYWGDNQPIGAKTSLYRVLTLDESSQHELVQSAQKLMGSLYSNKRIAQIIMRWIKHKISGKNQLPVLPIDFNHLECAEAVEWLFSQFGLSLPDDKGLGAFTPSSIVADGSPLQKLSDIVYAKNVTDTSRRVIAGNPYTKKIDWLTTVAQRLNSGGQLYFFDKHRLSGLARELLPQDPMEFSVDYPFAESRRYLRQSANASVGSNADSADFGRALLATGVVSLLLLSVGLLFILKKLVQRPTKLRQQQNAARATENIQWRSATVV